MKEDASSPMVSSEAVMLTCIVDANENREVVIVDIPNAFVQTVVEDKKDRAFICICGPLVNILVSTAPDVYGRGSSPKNIIFFNATNIKSDMPESIDR